MILENQGCQGKHLLKPNERKTSDKATSASLRFTTTSILIQKRDFKIHVCGNKQTCRASTTKDTQGLLSSLKYYGLHVWKTRVKYLNIVPY